MTNLAKPIVVQFKSIDHQIYFVYKRNVDRTPRYNRPFPLTGARYKNKHKPNKLVVLK